MEGQVWMSMQSDLDPMIAKSYMIQGSDKIAELANTTYNPSVTLSKFFISYIHSLLLYPSMFSIFRSRSSYCGINPNICHQFYGIWNWKEDPTDNSWWGFESRTISSCWSTVWGDDHHCHGSWGEDQVSSSGERI